MNLDQDTRFWIGALATAVALVVGYGVYREMNREEVPIASVQPIAPAESTVQATPEPGAPALQIQGASTAIGGTGGYEASVSGDEGLQYEWTIRGGTIEGDATGTTVTWTAGNGIDAILTCKATNATGKSTTVSLRVALQQPPSIERFEAVPAVVTEGTGARLSWTARNVQKLVLEPGGQDVSQYAGPTMDVKPAETTKYVLTATNATGIPVQREVTLKVVPPPTVSGFRADPVPGSATAFDVVGEFQGGKAELKNGGAVLTASETSPLRLRVPDLKEGATLSLTVTNEAGTYATATLAFSQRQ